MKKNIIIFLAIISFAACKNTKSPQTDERTVAGQKQVLEKETSSNDSESAQSTNLNMNIPNESEEHLIRTKNNIPDSLVARIQRTACFGRCPIYTISLYESGFATYQGEKWVENEGFFGAHVGLHISKTLQNMAEEIDFLNLQNTYDNEGVTDLPSTITTLRIKDEVKVVVNRMDGPEKLEKFENFFDSLFEDVEWDDNVEQTENK